MRFSLFIIAFLLLIVASCTDNPAEPEPPPANVSITLVVDVPQSFSWDSPLQKRFSASHPDGFSDGFVEFYMNDELVWSLDASGRSSVDTTWTQSFDLERTPMDFTADLEVKYNLVDAFERVDDRNSVSGSRAIAVTRSPYTEFTLGVLDRFSKGGLEGYVTFPNEAVVSVSGGEGFVSRDMKVLYEAVQGGSLRVVAEMSGYPDHSSQLRVDDAGEVGSVLVTPYNHGPFDLLEVQDRFLHNTRHEGFVSGMTTQRWRANTSITALFYDMSYLDNQTGEFVRSDDKDKITAPGFINNSVTALYEVVSMIPEDQNISVDMKHESKDEDFHFPRELDIGDTNPHIHHVGWPQAPFFLTRSTRLDGAYIRNASLSHHSGFEGSYDLSAPGPVRSDVIENFGIRTSGHGELLIDLDSRPEFTYNSLAPLVVDYAYSMPANSGRVELAGSGLPNSSGTRTTVFEDWVHDW